MARKMVSIAADNHRIFAVCDDGTLWMQAPAGGWSPVEGPADAPVEPPPGDAVVEGADVNHEKRKTSHGR